MGCGMGGCYSCVVPVARGAARALRAIVHRRARVRRRRSWSGIGWPRPIEQASWLTSPSRIGSLRLRNPIIAASGCFGYGVEYADAVDLSSLGGVAVKGLFLAEREGHRAAAHRRNAGGHAERDRPAGHRRPPVRRRKAARAAPARRDGPRQHLRIDARRVLRGRARAVGHEGVGAIELNISCPNIKEGGIQFGCSLIGHLRRRQRRPQGHAPAGDPEAHAERHRRRVVRARLRRSRRRRDLARQHVPGDGHRRRNATPEADERARRPQRAGDPADCRSHGLGVPSGGEAARSSAWAASRRPKTSLEFIIAGASAVQVGTVNFVDPFIWTRLARRRGRRT